MGPKLSARFEPGLPSPQRRVQTTQKAMLMTGQARMMLSRRIGSVVRYADRPPFLLPCRAHLPGEGSGAPSRWAMSTAYPEASFDHPLAASGIPLVSRMKQSWRISALRCPVRAENLERRPSILGYRAFWLTSAKSVIMRIGLSVNL